MTTALIAGFVVLWATLTPRGVVLVRTTELWQTAVLAVGGLSFGGFYAIAAMIPRRPWRWTVGLVAICLGLTGCTAPFAIPLLIFWVKPETKAAFGRI